MENVRKIHVNGLENTIINKEISIGYKKTKTKTRIKAKRNKKINYITYLSYANICLILFLIVSLVVGYTNSLAISSENNILEETIDGLSIEVNSLNEIVTPFNSKNRIEKIAQERLGMVYPSNNDIAKLESSTEEKLVSLKDFEIESNLSDNSNSIFTVITNIFR